MAIINIKNATVGRPLGTKGFNLIESYTKKDGTTAKSYFKVWTDQTFNEGAVVDVSGTLSVSGEVYEGQVRVSVSINNVKVSQGQASEPAKPVTPDLEMPF